jgi:DNA-binding MarR family transcriptional regulator
MVVEDISRLHRALKPTTLGKYQVSRAEIGMLFMLYYHPTASMKDLASQLYVSKSAVTQILEPLISRGLVNRTALPPDRRVAHLKLSEKGKKLIEKFNHQRTETLRAAIDTLTDSELNHFYNLNLKINQAIVRR